ncbi:MULTISPECIES: hypothetical protein [unclassified Streptomyces]|uniref:hypothetical protein n=1 Tax=unclassified Streptomyces TaxID=2593676 RepID=UPI0001C1A772|nr:MULTISPECIES: hypothetical protein [unclassified Streptomyces]AEN08386.1 hypothetical protein SACTE_0445 [Streptomyces sp. SirexAA-E]MYR66369.1 hypothetical protein [Streptomyces sp. SID4939]MYS03918.1 hypothetical protein [Streptomyces sp. SID4940]MYT66470.1 hypothetical protein [Streptomyces sp. SID8357]MYT83391.1 hypothetical protein [Streptomyces sp. SID8360]
MPSRARTVGRPAASAAVLAALLAVSAPPAASAPTDEARLRLETPETYVMYHADEGDRGTDQGFAIPVAVVPGGTAAARNVKVVVDASGLRGVARVAKGGYGNCTGEGWVFTCAYGTLRNDGESNVPFALLGVDGVEPGDSGTVTYTASADNAAAVTGSTRMAVGGPTLLSPEKEARVNGLEPGRPAELTPAFANRTRFTAEEGVAVRITADGGLTLTPRHSNCFYAGTAPTSAWCAFPTEAAPGTAYRTRTPLTYTAAERELKGTLVYDWSSAPHRPDGHAVRGTGAPLTLTRTPARGFSEGPSTVAVGTTVQADQRPVTGTVRGRVGDTVEVRLGVRDLGPGRPTGDEDRGRFEVVPPEGTTVTAIPYTFEDTDGQWACERPKSPGGAFVCDAADPRFTEGRQDAGTTVVGFRFRIDRQVPGARGTIRTYNPYDRTPGNDTGVIPLEAAPAPFHRALPHPVAWGAGGAAAAAFLYAVYRRRRARPGAAG